MYAVYDQHENPEEIARIGVTASCEFDNACELPMSLYSLKLRVAKNRIRTGWPCGQTVAYPVLRRIPAPQARRFGLGLLLDLVASLFHIFTEAMSRAATCKGSHEDGSEHTRQKEFLHNISPLVYLMIACHPAAIHRRDSSHEERRLLTLRYQLKRPVGIGVFYVRF